MVTLSDNQEIKALITASAMYPALEEMALSAKHEAFFSFRIFDPETEARSDRARELGLENWRQIIAYLGENGVRVRMISADFDPLFAADLHRDSYHNAKDFAKNGKGDTQVITALHGARVGAFWKSLLYFKVRDKLRQLRQGDEASDTPALRSARKGSWNIFPVTLHQKFAVIDTDQAIIGGMDVNPRRYDTPEHDRPSAETWHDVSASVTGQVCHQIRNHFIETWNAALSDDAEIFGEAADPFEPSELSDVAPKNEEIRVLRTVSRPKNGPFSFAPRHRLHEHEEAYLDLIPKAERFIYLETQFLRHMPIAQALAERAATAPDLNVVLLCPTEPERVAFGGDQGLDARHAQSLQVKCLKVLRKAFGDRFAAVSPAKPATATSKNGVLLNAGIVYVHAKVAIFDDHTSIIGSANLNGRSMLWDTEASIMVRDKDFAESLRKDLSFTWFGNSFETMPDTPLDRAATWADRALANADLAPEERTGFLLPYPKERNERFSLYAPILPNDMF